MRGINTFAGFPKYIIEYTKKGAKVGGQASKATMGGVYEINVRNKKYTILFKQGRNDGETISEFIAARLYNLVIPGYASTIFFATRSSMVNPKASLFVQKELHTEVYVGSIFFDHFKEIHKMMNFKERPTFLLPFHRDKSKEFIKNNYASNLGKVLAVSLWLGDYDTHISNLEISDVNGSFQFVKIDHGWSFAEIQDNMDYNKTPWGLRHGIGKPTNHFADYKQFGFYKNAEGEFLKMVDSLKLVTREQIQGVLQEAFKEINKYYSPQAYFTFAKWIGYPKGALVTEGSLIYYLTNKLMSRARTSLKRREGLPVFRTNTIFDSKGNDVGLATRL